LSPFSTCKARRSTCRELATPATVRLQGLATLLTVSALRARVGLVSCRRRSWDSPFGALIRSKGTESVTAIGEPACRSDRRYTPATNATGRHAIRDFRASTLSSIPVPSRRLSTTDEGRLLPWACSLSGYAGEYLGQGFPWLPLSRLRPQPKKRSMRLRVSIGTRLAPSTLRPKPTPNGATLIGFSHRYVPEHSRDAAFRAMCSPLDASCIAVDLPPSFGKPQHPA